MGEVIKAVDLGTYSHVPSDDQVNAMYDDGVRLAIIGLWHGQTHNPRAVSQLSQFKKRMKIAGYSFPQYPGGLNAREAISRSKIIAESHWNDLEFLALDFEHDVGNDPAKVLLEAIEETKKKGQTPIIYSAYWAWTSYMRDTEAAKELPCWYAQYDNVAMLGVPNPTFGGFTNFVGHQYKGSTNYMGVNVDLNVFDLSRIGDDMSEQTAEAYLKVARILNEAGSNVCQKKKPPLSVAKQLKYLSTLWVQEYED